MRNEVAAEAGVAGGPGLRLRRGLQTATAMGNSEDFSSNWSEVIYEATYGCLPGTLQHEE